MTCEGCGNPEAQVWLSGTRLCDRCFDDRVATHMGLPRLPDPPSPLVLTGPDGRRHRLRFRIWRAPTGIEVELEETEVAEGEGYGFAQLGRPRRRRRRAGGPGPGPGPSARRSAPTSRHPPTGPAGWCDAEVIELLRSELPPERADD